jgi:hypothetical protein
MPQLAITDGQLEYEPDGKILDEFVSDRSKVAVIVGPIGSGTSTASCMRIWFTACEQEPSVRDGKRHSRWAIVRNSYPLLYTSTLKTWLAWFPEEQYGTLVRGRPMNQTIRIADLDLEVWFLALDDESDVHKLRSTEWTGIFFNEVEYQTYTIWSEGHSRVAQGRYPPMMDGGPTWHGIIADMNAPPEDHFISRMAGWSDWPEETPEGDRLKWDSEWWLKKQPPGLIEIIGPDKRVSGYLENPQAENRKWLKEGYLEVIKGKTKQWIDSRVMNRVTFIVDGDPVWPNFRADRHLANESLPFVPGREVIGALDFGRRPCAIFAQEIGDRIQVQREFRMYGVSSVIYAPQLKRFAERWYRGASIRWTGDPKGADRNQASDQTSYEIFRSYGMPVTPAPAGHNNDLPVRLEAVSYALETSRILVGTDCPTLRAALSGKYCLTKMENDKYEPVKRGPNAKYSDVADCLQYLCLFLGEGRRMIGLTPAPAAMPARMRKERGTLRRIMS